MAINNSTSPIPNSKKWERTGKSRFFFGGCNCRKGKHLRFCRASNSQCGGQGFDPPLLHHLVSTIYGCRHWRPYFICGQFVDTSSGTQFYRLNGHAFRFFNQPHVTHSHANIRVAQQLSNREKHRIRPRLTECRMLVLSLLQPSHCPAGFRAKQFVQVTSSN